MIVTLPEVQHVHALAVEYLVLELARTQTRLLVPVPVPLVRVSEVVAVVENSIFFLS